MVADLNPHGKQQFVRQTCWVRPLKALEKTASKFGIVPRATPEPLEAAIAFGHGENCHRFAARLPKIISRV